MSILTPPDLKDEIAHNIARIKRDERVEHYETRRRTKNGDIIFVSRTISPIKDASGAIVGASAIERDITELVHAREKARESEEALRALNEKLEQRVSERTSELQKLRDQDRANLQRLKLIVSNLPFAAIALDEHATILEVNQLYCDLFAIDSNPTELSGKSGDLLSDEWFATVTMPRERIAHFRKAYDRHIPLLDEELTLNDGRVLVRDFIPIVDEDGTFRGQLVTYKDVTQERRIDAAKSEFMSLASHQLRTPLTAVRWVFGRLTKNLSGSIGSLEEKLLSDGKSAAAYMSETINTMLQISQIQAGQIQLNRTELCLADFLHEAMESHRPQALQKLQSLSVQCEPNLRIQTDPQLLKEVIANLLSNAIKYTPKNGTVFLSADTGDDRITINVKDSGYGIPQHQQSKVFRKFFRGDNVVSRETDGTGLGLYLVSLITELLGGDISFVSDEGLGTTFSLRLPR